MVMLILVIWVISGKWYPRELIWDNDSDNEVGNGGSKLTNDSGGDNDFGGDNDLINDFSLGNMIPLIMIQEVMISLVTIFTVVMVFSGDHDYWSDDFSGDNYFSG